MNEGQKFIVYAIAWGILTIIFTILSKKTKDIKKKKMLSLISGLSIVALMFGVAIWMGFPLKPLSVFFVLALILVCIGQKYTFYCQACSHTQQPFSKAEFCSKCGAKIEY